MLKSKLKKRMLLVNSESDPNFDAFMKAGGGGSTPDPVEEPEELDPIEEDPIEGEELEIEGEELEIEGEEQDEDIKPNPNQTIQMLQEQITNLTNLVSSFAQKKEPEPVLEPEVDIFESEDFQALSEGMSWDDKEKNLMKKFLSKALEANQKNTLKLALNDLPNLVNTTVTKNQSHAEMRTNFFKEHSALEPVKKYVSEVASSIVEEYKQIGKKASLPEILNEAANRTYKVLGIKKSGKKDAGESRDGKPNPAFPNTRSSSRKPAPKVSKMQTDIAAIMSLTD